METDVLDHGAFHRATCAEPVIVFKNPQDKFFVGTVTSLTPHIKYDKDFSYVESLHITTNPLLEIMRRDDDDLQEIFEVDRWMPVKKTLVKNHKMFLENISHVSEKNGVLHIKFGNKGSLYIFPNPQMDLFVTRMVMAYSAAEK